MTTLALCLPAPATIFGVLLRYEDVDDAAPPCIGPDGFEALVSRTIDWAAEILKKEN